jgi:RecA-family ATPase
MNAPHEMTAWRALMPTIARVLLGDENKSLSTAKELRFGNKGSVAVDTGKGTWFDHEAGHGGGVIDLVQQYNRCDRAGALRWLEDRGYMLPTNDRTATPRETIHHVYRDARGNVLRRVMRQHGGGEEKRIWQEHLAGNAWVKGGGDAPEVPYRLPELLAASPADPVFVVEGEACADLLAAKGYVVTCNRGGAGKWKDTLANHFTGRRVIILSDNDDTGRDHAEDVARKLHGIAASVAMLDLPGLPPKGDVVDWFKAGGTRAQFDGMVKQAGPRETVQQPRAGFSVINAGAWAGQSAPPRPWIVQGWLPSKAVTLLAGDGGTGKSLMVQQWLSCLSQGLPFIGVRGVLPVRCLYLNCEDPADELWRRQESIARALDRQMTTFADDMVIAPRLGESDNSLGSFTEAGRFVPGALFEAVRAHCVAHGVRVLALDNVAHLYSGHENIRGEVTAFLNALSRLALEIDGAVILVGHPAKADDSQYSGSTAWENGVRNRLFLSRPDDGAGNALDNTRILSRNKANLASIGDKISMAWHEGAFYPPGAVEDETARDAVAESTFLACLDHATQLGRNTSDKPSPAYAPKMFASMKQARGIKQRELERAMQRLFDRGEIIANAYLWHDKKSRHKAGIKRAENVPNHPPEPVPQTTPKRPEPLPQTVPHTHPYTTYNGGAFGAPARSEDHGQAEDFPTGDWVPEHWPDDDSDYAPGGPF